MATSKGRMQAAFPEHNPNPVLSFDAAGKLSSANQSVEDIAKALGVDDPLALLPPDYENIVIKSFSAGLSLLGHETVIEDRTFSWSFIPQRDTGIVYCYGEDITERKAAEGRLQQSEGLIEKLFDVTSDAILIIDPKIHLIRDANQAAIDMLQYDKEELLDLPYSHIDAAGAANFERLTTTAGSSEPAQNKLVTFKTKNGGTVKAECSFSFTQFKGQQYLFLIARDATERLISEEALRESEKRYRLLFDANPYPMLIFDLNTLKFLAVNDAAVHQYGYSENEFLKMIVKDLWPAVGVDTTTKKLSDLKEGLNSPGLLRHVKKDGTIIDVEVITHQIKFTGVNATLSLALDVTDRRKTEEALSRSEEQLRQSQKMDAIGQLASGVAHDFNNLLTAIMGYSDLLLQDQSLDGRIRDGLQEISKASHRAESLTRQLLAFSRHQALKPKVLDLNVVVADMKKMFHRLIGENINLKSNMAAEIASVKADPGQIEQVILNLVVNARDAMPTGGELCIETANVVLDKANPQQHPGIKSGAYVVLTVTDNGIGMNADIQSHIFEPFYTTKVKGAGTGLGLATVYGIVKQSGGSIQVHSEEGVGTTFKIYLPQVEAEDQPPVIEPSTGSSRTGTEIILLVEDEEIVRNLTSQVLSEKGYQVLEADHAEQALKLSAQFDSAIDLILTDMIMPGMNGKELAKTVCSQRPGIKVLFMSGYTDDPLLELDVSGAGASFIQKPFTADALLQKVRAILDNTTQS